MSSQRWHGLLYRTLKNPDLYPPKKLLDSMLSKVAAYEVDTQKSIVFLYNISNAQSEKENKKMIPLQ